MIHPFAMGKSPESGSRLPYRVPLCPADLPHQVHPESSSSIRSRMAAPVERQYVAGGNSVVERTRGDQYLIVLARG
jgi:hypothetical protein